jgi:hypothetical protein
LPRQAGTDLQINSSFSFIFFSASSFSATLPMLTTLTREPNTLILSVSIITEWPSKAIISWWSMTQLAQMSEAEVKQLAKACESADLPSSPPPRIIGHSSALALTLSLPLTQDT